MSKQEKRSEGAHNDAEVWVTGLAGAVGDPAASELDPAGAELDPAGAELDPVGEELGCIVAEADAAADEPGPAETDETGHTVVLMAIIEVTT